MDGAVPNFVVSVLEEVALVVWKQRTGGKVVGVGRSLVARNRERSEVDVESNRPGKIFARDECGATKATAEDSLTVESCGVWIAFVSFGVVVEPGVS